MHDQFPVRELHRVAYLVEELQALVHRGIELRAVVVDGTALHELHHDVGRPVVADARIVEAGDVGVLERGEDALLEEEPPPELPRQHPGADQLDGHAAVEAVVVPVREIDRPHATPTDLPEEPVGTDPAPHCPAVLPGPRHGPGALRHLAQELRDERPEGALQEVVGGLPRPQGPAGAHEEGGVPAAGAGQEGVPLRRRELEGSIEGALEPLPVLRGQGVHAPRSAGRVSRRPPRIAPRTATPWP